MQKTFRSTRRNKIFQNKESIMNIIPIVFAFDNNLVMPAYICISSLLRNAQEDTFYDIFILHSLKEDIDKTTLNEIPQHHNNCSIKYRTIGNEFDNAFEVRGITTPAYYRLLIPELIPEYDKVIYSDVDVIFREDLYDFYQTDLGDNYLGAVDVGIAFRPKIRNYVQDTLRLDPSNGYFYSGNLIINSALIRRDKLTNRFKELAKNAYNYQDMDILNIACNGRIKPLSPGFCLTNYLLECIYKQRETVLMHYSEKDIQHAIESGIIHYNGEKPWKGWCYNQDIWWAHYRQSGIYDDAFVFNYYQKQLNATDNWSFIKRLKHLLRYFRK